MKKVKLAVCFVAEGFMCCTGHTLEIRTLDTKEEQGFFDGLSIPYSWLSKKQIAEIQKQCGSEFWKDGALRRQGRLWVKKLEFYEVKLDIHLAEELICIGANHHAEKRAVLVEIFNEAEGPDSAEMSRIGGGRPIGTFNWLRKKIGMPER